MTQEIKIINTIKILGTGCPGCKKLADNVENALKELNLEKSIKTEKITDITKIMEFGVMSLPALVFNNEVVSYGKINTKKEVQELLGN